MHPYPHTYRATASAAATGAVTVSSQGLFERAEGGARLTRYVPRATLHAPAGVDRARATQLLEKAEHGCLVAASLNGVRELTCEIIEG
jgi:organic hydroperoxide reductase OsmC/OhrA